MDELTYEEKLAERKEEMQKALEKVVDLLNTMTGEKEMAEAFFSSLVGQHRTLQANFWRMIQSVAKAYGETKWHDLRNQAAVEYCKKISGVEQHIPFI